MLLRLFLLALFCSGVALLRFENGSYTEVIVAFDGVSIRTRDQVRNLEKLIKVASRELYKATDGLAYFKQVIILANGERVSSDAGSLGKRSVFSRADIRIGSPYVEYAIPDVFTLQTGECGEQGRFILLSDSFIRDLNSESTTKLAARRLVQEWARYRYGVFDEILTWSEESFRWEGLKEISPATCADGIKGWAMTEYHERCVLDCGRVGSNCRFFPDIKNNSGVESSLMSYPHLPDVNHFCNISNHNRKAPSMQNKMCNSRSIMEVIQAHEDFKDANRWLDTTKKVPPKETDLIQKFDLWRRFYFVFIVESSQMMEEENGTQEVQDFIERFFVHLAPRRAKAGFIKFSNESKTLWWNVSVWDKNEWQNISNELNVSTHVGSPSAPPDIGKALHEAYEKYGYGFPMFILISTGDGKVEVKPEYNSWWRTIHSIVIGRNSSWKADRLSQMNGGDSYFFGDIGSGTGEPRTFNLDMAFLSSMQSVAEDYDQTVVIRYERFTTIREWDHYDFRVDDGTGKELVVTFSPNYTIYELLNPHLYSTPYKSHQYGSSSIAKSISVGDAEEVVPVDIMITATPRSNGQGSWVWVRAWIANVTEDKKGNGTKGYHRIYAEVKKGYSPVINTKVEATVEIMDQRDPIRVTLKDNGGVPDVFKDDGIYSNFFPVTKRPAGRPIVIVRVSNDDGNAGMKIAGCRKSRSTYGMLDNVEYQRAIEEFGVSKSRFSKEDFALYARNKSYCKERKEKERICTVPLPLPFTRATMTNSPILLPMSEDEVLQTPPAAIWDLKVVGEDMREGEFFALLQWTSPEHPRLSTTVERIEVCGLRNQNFVTSKDCQRTENIIDILKVIAPAGEVQQFEVKIEESMVNDSAGKIHNLYFALRAQDQGGNAGDMSNVAEAFFQRFDVEGVKGREGEDGRKEDDGRDESVKEETGSRSWVPWTAGTVVVVLAAVVGAFGYLKWKNKWWMPTHE